MYVGPWQKDINPIDATFSGVSYNEIYIRNILGKESFYCIMIGGDFPTEKGWRFKATEYDFFPTKESAMAALDEELVKYFGNGITFLTRERWDKLSVLL